MRKAKLNKWRIVVTRLDHGSDDTDDIHLEGPMGNITAAALRRGAASLPQD